jgi:hypothetical protein
MRKKEKSSGTGAVASRKSSIIEAGEKEMNKKDNHGYFDLENNDENPSVSSRIAREPSLIEIMCYAR